MVEFRVCSSGMNDDGVELAVGEPLQYDIIPYATRAWHGKTARTRTIPPHDSSEFGRKEKKLKL